MAPGHMQGLLATQPAPESAPFLSTESQQDYSPPDNTSMPGIIAVLRTTPLQQRSPQHSSPHIASSAALPAPSSSLVGLYWAAEVGEYCGDVGLYCGEVGLYWGEVGEYLGELGLYCGEVGEYCGEVGLYCGEVGLYWGEVGEYWGEVGLYCGDVGLYCGDVGL